MAVPQLLVLGSLALGVVGAATATDLVSLREIAHAVELPLISGAIILARDAMPSGVAHLLEPLAALAGLSVLAVAGVYSGAPSRIRTGDLSLERAAS